MTTFRGFTTRNRFRKFTIVDLDLIKIDLINAFNIRKGEKPGNPRFGSSIWTFVFEPLTDATMQQIIQEAERVITNDPRLAVNNVDVFAEDGGVLLEISLLINPSATPLDVQIRFDENVRRALLN